MYKVMIKELIVLYLKQVEINPVINIVIVICNIIIIAYDSALSLLIFIYLL